MEWGAFYERLDSGPPHIYCLWNLSNYPDPDDFLRSFRIQSRWQNERYNGLVEEARRVADQGKRMALYQDAERLLIEEAAIMPLAYGRCHLLVKPWVRRWPISMTRFWFWKDVIIDPH
jgi:ABC-type transport system substrate-binding protein